MDASATMGEGNTAKSAEFVREIVEELDIGQDKILTALVTYADHPEVSDKL